MLLDPLLIVALTNVARAAAHAVLVAGIQPPSSESASLIGDRLSLERKCRPTPALSLRTEAEENRGSASPAIPPTDESTRTSLSPYRNSCFPLAFCQLPSPDQTRNVPLPFRLKVVGLITVMTHTPLAAGGPVTPNTLIISPVTRP